MEVVVGMDTLAVLVALAVGIVGLATTVTASARRTRVELKAEFATEISRLDDRLSQLDDRVSRLDDRVSRLDDRVYVLAAGLAPRLAPAREAPCDE
ncbi:MULTISPECIES: hypothetical protein [Microbacterium]|uniref:DUF2746 domain-containing protein n=1 Tax=Microbacterium schleiferi TaxID=69362 RepID=A0ABU7V2X1_9MICO|nr:hypothetical protein [Microbacterium sp.]MBD3752757.1 hypothetical protein [Micrococcales bacterium]